MMLKAGSDPNIPAFNYETPIREAVVQGRLANVKALLAAGCPADTRDGAKVRHPMPLLEGRGCAFLPWP